MKNLMEICKTANYEAQAIIKDLVVKSGFNMDYRIDPSITDEDEKTVLKLVKVIQGGFYTYKDEEKFVKQIEVILKKYLDIFAQIQQDEESKRKKIETLMQSLPEILLKHDKSITKIKSEIEKTVNDLIKEGQSMHSINTSISLSDAERLKGFDKQYVEGMINLLLNK